MDDNRIIASDHMVCGLSSFTLMVECLNELSEDNCPNRIEVVQRFANHAIDIYEAFEKFSHFVAETKSNIEKEIITLVDALDAVKLEFKRSFEKLATTLQRKEQLEEDRIAQSKECDKQKESLKTFDKDIEKAKENEQSATSLRNGLLISSGLLAVTIIGIPLAAPLLYGALGPAQSSIDSCTEAKAEAKKRYDEKLTQLKTSLTNLQITNDVEELCCQQIVQLAEEIMNGTDDVQQFKVCLQQWNQLNLEMFGCLHLVKTLTERHSLVLQNVPLALYSCMHQCILYNIRSVLDVVKSMNLPLDVEQICPLSMPEISLLPISNDPTESALMVDEVLPLQPLQSSEQLLDLLLTMPVAIHGLHRMIFLSDPASGPQVDHHNVTVCTHLVCNTLSDVHSLMDGLNGMIKNMQIMFTTGGRQMVAQLEENEGNFDFFDACINGLQLTAAAGGQKVAQIESSIRKCLDFLTYFCESLIQLQFNINKSIDGNKSDLETIAIENEASIQRQQELTEQKVKIEESLIEMEENFYSSISDVTCDKTILAADIGIELAFDVVFFFLPFMKAAEFADEALVVGRFLCTKIAKLGPAIRAKFLSCITKNQNDIEDTPETKRLVYSNSDFVTGFIDEIDQFISEDGRLAVHMVLIQHNKVIKCQILSFLDSLAQSNVPESRVLGELMALCLSGIAVCDLIDVLECRNLDCTTAHSDEIVSEIQNFIQTANEFVTEAERLNQNQPATKRNRAKWYHVFLNGFTGYRAKNKLFVAQVSSDNIENQETRLKPIKRSINKERINEKSRKLHEVLLQLRQTQNETYLAALLELQTIISDIRMAWNEVCFKFGRMEILLKAVSDKISTINIQSSTSVWIRMLAYQKAFEAVQEFQQLSALTNSYLAMSEKHFIPMLQLLMKPQDDDDESVCNQIQFHEMMEQCVEDTQMTLAIEMSKIEDDSAAVVPAEAI